MPMGREGDSDETMDLRPLARATIERTVALWLLLIALPLILGAAAISFWCYRAWPFFVHDRVGYTGRRMRMVKVRSLPPSTRRYVDKYAIRDVEIPRSMRAMRRLHLDELPQLWHVVRGDMTFVGPRPEMAALHDALDPEFAAVRTSVRPGLTGLWQISPHNVGLIGERPEYDRLYVAHRTASLDLWIVFRTIVKMSAGTTTHLHEVPRATIGPQPPVVPKLVAAHADT